jgi:adenylate cyclase
MTDERAKRKLTAILSADVKGYSRLMGEDEGATVATLKKYRDIISSLVGKHSGRVVDSPGDNLLAEFGSVVDAVECAVKIQEDLQEKNATLPEHRRMEFRIGVNLGDVIDDEGRIYGDGVNIAARVEGLAVPGGICISGKVYKEVKNRLGLEYEYLGEHSLKNIAEPIQVYRVALMAEVNLPEMAREIKLHDEPSIAVLPFVNMSEDSEQDYFADGIAEDIITALSKFRWLLVIARNTTFKYKGGNIDIKQIAAELGARYVLEGSVRKAGSRVRITAQLINTTTGSHIWAERYDRELVDIFTVQDEITENVVSSIQPKLDWAEIQRAKQKPAESLDAWDYVQRGRWHIRLYTKEGNYEAQQLFKKAIEVDPTYVPALAAMAFAHVQELFFGWCEAPGKSLAEAAELAKQALSFDQFDPWVHCVMGLHYFISQEPDKAIAHFQEAIELNPSFALAHGYLGAQLAYAGESEEAIAEANRAIRLSPRDPELFHFFLAIATAHFVAGRFDEAVEWSNRIIQEEPGVPAGHRLLAASYGQLGRTEEASAALEGALRVAPYLSLASVKNMIHFKNPAHSELYVEGLRKAGLQ